ncbi:MAG: membrane protein insertion efficiency factor YidD [Planctomycetota bacterium]
MRWLGKLLVFPLVLLIRLYQVTISPLLPPSCRYTPSCSQYAVEALSEWGPIHGGWLALRRILRCHPWGGHGPDPVPPRDAADEATTGDGSGTSA